MATTAPTGTSCVSFSPVLFDSAAAAQQRAIIAARQAAAAAAERARQAEAAAAAARQKAEQSRIAAEQAEKAAAARNASKTDKDNAVKLRATATTDEADAEKKESAAEVATADKALTKSKLDDLNAGRQPTNPSATTVKAQAEYDAATKTDAIVNEKAGDPHSPLAEAQADTAAKLKAAKAASKAVAEAKANGQKPSAEQLAAEKQTQADWSDAIQHQLRVAGADATSHGKDPSAAIDAQVDQIVKDVRNDGYFDADSMKQGLTSTAQQLKTESPAQRDLMLEYESVQADGQKQVADAKTAVTDLDTKADQAEAAAKTPVYGPYLPGKAPPATTNPTTNPVVVPYAPTFANTSANTGTNSTPSLLFLAPANTPQFRATQARAAANAAQTKLDTLEAAFGHTDAKDPSLNTIGTVQADFNKRGADIGATDARNNYLKVLVDPASTPKQTSDAYDAWQTAVDQQTLMTQMQIAINADATLLQAQQNQAQAQTDYDQTKAGQPLLIQTTNGYGQSGSLAPDGHDQTFNVDYHNADDAKHVQLVNGTYSYKSEVNGQTTVQPLNPVAGRLWQANAALDAAQTADKTANDNLKQTWLDQHGGADGTGLDAAGWLKKSDQYTKELNDASSAVTTAQQNLQMAKDGMQPETVLQTERSLLGAALQQQSLAQARVDAVTAMQTLRNAQMWSDPDGRPPSNLSTLTDNARAAVKKVGDLSGTQAMTPADAATLRDKTLPDERSALSALDVKLQTAKSAADAAPGDAAAQKTYTDLANQYDWLDHKITVQQTSIAYADAQRAALAAPFEYGNTQRPGGADLHTRTHNGANDSALTWGITPGQDGQPVLSGLPSNIQPEDVHVQKKDGVWTVSFDKDAGTFAARTMAAGRGGAYTTYVDDSNKDDIAIEKGHSYTLNADAARYWEATNTSVGTGPSTLVNVKAAYDDAVEAASHDPLTDATGQPTLTNNQLSTSQTAMGPDGNPVPTIDFNVDQTANKKVADAKVTATAQALATAQDAQNAGVGDPTKLKSTVADATADHELALSAQSAVGAVLDWQVANRTRQAYDVDQRAGRPATMCYAKSPQENADDLLDVANAKVSHWVSARQKLEVGRAQTAVDTAQTAYDQYLNARPYLSGASASDSTEAQNLQAAKVKLDSATRLLAGAAGPTAEADQKAFVAANLAPGGENDPHAMYELFMKDPRVMSQALINSDYAQKGGLPTEMHNRTELRNTVALELGYTPSMALDPTAGAAYAQTMQTQDLFGNLDKDRRELLDKTVDQIVSVGGEHAKVTTLPVVYAIDGDKDKGGGIVKTAVFKVENQDGNGTHLVDEYGERYDDVDDYRANNNLAVDGVNLAMPKDGKFTLDSNGNVELFTGDARTETDWQRRRRNYHVDAIVGGLAIVGGVLLEFGSVGTLTPVAGALILGGASLYGVTTSAQALTNRYQHGLSVNAFTDREAGMDWLNLGASALALPSLGSAGRFGMMAWRAERAAAGGAKLFQAAHETSTFVSLTGKGAMVTGGAAMADGGAYMAQNWDHMSDADRWEQGGMFLLNLASFGTHPAAKAFKQRGAAPKLDNGPLVDPKAAGAKNADGSPVVETVADTGTTTTATGGTRTLDVDSGGTQPIVAGDGAPPLLTVADTHGTTGDTTPTTTTTSDTGAAQNPLDLGLPSPRGDAGDPAPIDLLGSSRNGDPTLAAASGTGRPGGRSSRNDAAHEDRALDHRQAERTNQRKQAAAGPLARVHEAEREVLVQGDVGRPLPEAAPRTEGLGTHATMDELLESGALPGEEGITLTGGFSYGDLYRLSTLGGRRIEFSLTFENVGGGQRVRRLYSGSVSHSPAPVGARLVAHTHPTPHANQRFASPGDMALFNKRHDEALALDPNAAPRPHFVVWGEKTGPQGDYTTVYPGPYKHGYGEASPGALRDHEVGVPDPGATTAPAPPPTGRNDKGVPLPPETATLRFDNWRDVLLQSDALAEQADPASGVATPPAASPAEQTIMQRLLRPGQRARFVVSQLSPHEVMANGVDLRGSNATKDIGTATARAKKLGGAWVYRVDLPGGRAAPRAEGVQVGGALRVHADGSRMGLAIPNLDAAMWQQGSRFGVPDAPTTAALRLQGWDEVMAHSDALAAQYRPGSGANTAAPSGGESALMARVQQGRAHNLRVRFSASNVSPHEAVADVTRVLGDTKKSFDKAADAGRANGDTWVYRLEPTASRWKGLRSGPQYEVVGAVRVFGDGSTMPLPVVNDAAHAWTRGEQASLKRVLVSAGGGVATVAVLTAGAHLVLPAHVIDNTLTWAAGGSLLRAVVKSSRFLNAYLWQSRLQTLRGGVASKTRFERALNELSDLGKTRGTPQQRRAFQTAVDQVRNRDVHLWQERFTRRAQLRSSIKTLASRAEALGLQPDDLVASLRAGVKDKTKFDRALQIHTNLAERLGKKYSLRNLLTGIPKNTVDPVQGQVKAVQTAVKELHDNLPDNDADAMKNLNDALSNLQIAPNLRGAKSKIRWGIDIAQTATYAISLAYLARGMPADLFTPTGVFALANAADAVRIVGTRLGNHLPGLKAPEGQPKVGDHAFYTKGLTAADETLTTAGGGFLGGLSGWAIHQLGWSVPRAFDAVAKGLYATASGTQFLNSVVRGYKDPAPENLPGRTWYLLTRTVAGGAAILLTANTVAQSLIADQEKKDAKAAPSPSPSPTTSPSPSTPSTSGPTTPPGPTQPPVQPPAQPPSPAQVVVTAHDPRLATLWGIADANASTLLSMDEIASDRQRGGDDAVVLDALQQLFQVNPQRGFRPELMDGVATALRGDPDTIQPGWKITVEG